MEHSALSVHIVDLTHDEWIQALFDSKTALDFKNSASVPGQGPQSHSRFIGLILGLTREQVDAALRPIIKELPPIGGYMVRPVDGMIRVRWRERDASAAVDPAEARNV